MPGVNQSGGFDVPVWYYLKGQSRDFFKVLCRLFRIALGLSLRLFLRTIAHQRCTQRGRMSLTSRFFLDGPSGLADRFFMRLFMQRVLWVQRWLGTVAKPRLAVFAAMFGVAVCALDLPPAHAKQEPSRNMRLTAFNPHRSSFSCTHEASKVPPIDSQAQAWFEEGMALSSYGVYYEDRDIPKAVALWQKAAERKHWKAMLNLASIYARGDGEGPFHVKRDTERAVLLTEDAMRLGIPAAFDLMGTLHAEGRGVKASVDRAWAFWQLAADMGNPDAMAHIGSVSAASYDDTRRGRWANRKIALQMLGCGMAQGNGKAAYELGVALNGNDPELDEDYTKALQALHAAVKFGHQPAAGSLFVAFDNGKPLVDHRVDKDRAERYFALSRALLRNPDLRLPNLDRILPLPPAELPRWDGDTKSLVQSAIGVR